MIRGYFDPGFLGIQLEKYLKYEKVLRELTPNLTEYDFILQQMSANADEGLEWLFYFYAPVHEKKHFYDFFLSYFGNKVFRLKLVNAINFFSLLVRINDHCLPVPLRKWSQLSIQEKEFYSLKALSKTGKAIFDIEHTTSDEQAIFAHIIKCQERIDEFYRYDVYPIAGTAITTQDLLECNALIVQTDYIGRRIHDEMVNDFLGSIITKKIPGANVLYLLYKTFPNPTTRYILSYYNTLITWSLMGNFNTDPQELPTKRLFRALHFMETAIIDYTRTTPEQFFRLLDRALSKSPFEKSFLATRQLLNDCVHSMKSPFNASTPPDSWTFIIEPVLIPYQKMISQFFELFLTDMNSFLDCNRFNAGNDSNPWPMPPTMIRTHGYGLVFEKETDTVYPFDWVEIDGKKLYQRWLEKSNMHLFYNSCLDIRTMYDYIHQYDQLFLGTTDPDEIIMTFTKRRLEKQNVSLIYI